MDYKERIRALREDNDYTQSRIAGLLNIGQNTYADYELGKTRIPVDSLIKLAQFYDVDMNYITDISKTVHKFPKEKQQLAAVNKRKKIVIPEHTLHCCQFYPIQLSKLIASILSSWPTVPRVATPSALVQSVHPEFWI